ncbi:zinc finger protein weckle [Drosophila elegans]|uniref:zinc finger protein weckle n=1 Tax=Drosophila elegans TaxID=30023 RepID=UPI0007E75E3B|nr:zinc finger protein weckle [Drosophila elegans]
MGVPTTDWLYWCRLCARDDAVIKVRPLDEDLVRIISKCFDVEMTLEEPELGSMLCEECYTVVGQLLTFSESVTKVQAIFELLRHSEPQDSQELDALRRQYGLPPTCKQELEFLEIDEQEDKCSSFEEPFISDHSTAPSPEIQKMDRKHQLEELDTSDHSTAPSPGEQTKRGRKSLDYDSQMEVDLILDEDDIMVLQPEKRKRGRPRGRGKLLKQEDSQNRTPCKSEGTAKAKAQRQSPKDSGSPQVGADQSPGVDDFICKACNESFMSFMALRRHKHDMHGGPKRFVCDCCGKGLKTFTSLVEHQLVHTDEKPCVCPVCNAAFKNKARLRVHSQTHGEPQFKCDICGKKLQTRAILNKHKYVHTEERRFKCEICGSGCKNSTALKIHLLGHTGLRPYVCKYCGKAFASNTNCRSHKWKKHPELAAKEDETESSRVPVPTLEELRAITREMAKTASRES